MRSWLVSTVRAGADADRRQTTTHEIDAENQKDAIREALTSYAELDNLPGDEELMVYVSPSSTDTSDLQIINDILDDPATWTIWDGHQTRPLTAEEIADNIAHREARKRQA